MRVDDAPHEATASHDSGVPCNNPVGVDRVQFLQYSVKLCGPCTTIGEYVLVTHNRIPSGRCSADAVDSRVGVFIAARQTGKGAGAEPAIDERFTHSILEDGVGAE